MKKRSIEEIPFGSYCYSVVEMKPDELDGDLHQPNKTLCERPYHGLRKTVFCRYWRETDYGMTICDFTGDQSLNEDETGAREKALDHFGSEEMFYAHWTSDELYDQVKCCGIHEEKQEPHLAPMLLESLLRILSEDNGADELYQARVRRFLVNFGDKTLLF